MVKKNQRNLVDTFLEINKFYLEKKVLRISPVDLNTMHDTDFFPSMRVRFSDPAIDLKNIVWDNDESNKNVKITKEQHQYATIEDCEIANVYVAWITQVQSMSESEYSVDTPPGYIFFFLKILISVC